MHAGHSTNPVLDGLLITIIIAYFAIAYQFWTRRKGAQGRATRALGQLVVIFVFCAVCGYVPRLVAIPEAVLIVAHAVLAAAAWAYMVSGQVDRLLLAVDYADLDTPENAARAKSERQAELNAEIEACARLAEQGGSKVTASFIRRRLRDEAADAPAVAEAGNAATA